MPAPGLEAADACAHPVRTSARTVELTGNQWLISIGASSTVVVVSEIWKPGLQRRSPA